MAVPNTFASATSAIPLANLDANFAYYDAGFSLSGTAVTFAGSITLTSGTANGVPYLNASKVLTSGSVLTFDGTILSSTRFAGALNGTVGATTATTGAFTTLTTSSTVTISGGTANGVAYLNGSKVLTTGTALTFDGTNLGAGASITTGSGVSTGDCSIEVGGNRTGDGNAFIDFHATSGTDNELRIIRASGVNGNAFINNAGTGNFTLNQLGAGSLIFATTGSERMRLTSTGLGIGTSSPGAKLDVAGAVIFQGEASNGGTVNIGNIAAYRGILSYTGSGDTVLSIKNSYDSADAAINFIMRSAGTPVTALTITGSGNLGLGVVPSAWTLESAKAIQYGTSALASGGGGFEFMYSNAYINSSDVAVYYQSSLPATAYRMNSADGIHKWYNAASGTAGNAITFTQAMTLDASGFYFLGCTTTPSASVKGIRLTPDFTTNTPKFSTGAATGLVYMIEWINGNGIVGSISTSGSTTAYNTSSDYRLKNITGPITTSGAYIDSLKPVEGTWKADGSTFVGLIAHETQEVSRTTVATGTKDGEQMQGMDYSSAEIIANLIAELQSLRARVAQLESK